MFYLCKMVCGFLNLQVILEINTLSPRFVYHCATLRLRNQERIWDNDLAKKGFRLFFAVREPLSVVNIAPPHIIYSQEYTGNKY